MKLTEIHRILSKLSDQDRETVLNGRIKWEELVRLIKIRYNVEFYRLTTLDDKEGIIPDSIDKEVMTQFTLAFLKREAKYIRKKEKEKEFENDEKTKKIRCFIQHLHLSKSDTSNILTLVGKKRIESCDKLIEVIGKKSYLKSQVYIGFISKAVQIFFEALYAVLTANDGIKYRVKSFMREGNSRQKKRLRDLLLMSRDIRLIRNLIDNIQKEELFRKVLSLTETP